MIRPSRQVLALENVRDEARDVKTFTFDADYDLAPGQFVNIRFAEEDSLGRRSFSIASAPGERLALTIKKVGSFTNAIFDAPIGTRFEILGPLGLPYVRTEGRFLFIAGGSGIAPFRSLLRSPDAPDDVLLLYSVRREEDLIYRDEIERWPCETRVTLSREEKEEFLHGRISEELLASLDLTGRKAVVCGPPGLVSASISALTKLGVPMSDIKTERWN